MSAKRYDPIFAAIDDMIGAKYETKNVPPPKPSNKFFAAKRLKPPYSDADSHTIRERNR